MRILAITILVITFLTATTIFPAETMAQHGTMMHEMYKGGPYGNYCPGMAWGPYGVRNPVRTAEEAKQVIETYLSDNKEGVRVGKIQEKNLYFEAEILDRNKKLIDRAIVDKRTGRIRSIY